MSQSPLTANPAEDSLRYQQGWRALNRLLHESRSFSGNEKNCAFLNCGPTGDGQPQAFADISSAVGFDFPDDGRGLAFVDWDFDGDLDVWTTNRTAPRLRFLGNSNRSGHAFISFRVQGNGRDTNRDAIGTRLALYLEGNPVPMIKTLHAGHAFLSQSSRWLHFGLGPGPAISKVVAHWPNGSREEFGSPEAGRFYELIQGSGKAVPWQPPSQAKPLVPSDPVLPTGTDLARIVVPPGMQLPTLWVQDGDSEPAPFQRSGKGPLLVNLWASYCLPCRKELKAWAQEQDRLRSAGIEVIALNTDAVAGAEDARTQAEQAIARAGFPFPWAEAAPVTVRTLDIFTNAVLDLWKPLPVPSSFLVDGNGEVLVIYKGPVSAEQVSSDTRLAKVSPEERRQASVPFPGRWVGPPHRADSIRVASQLLDRNESTSALHYLEELIGVLEKRLATESDRRDLGDARYFLAILLGQHGRNEEARSQLEGARELIPHDIRVRLGLADLYQGAGHTPAAIGEVTAAIRIKPSDLALHDRLASLHVLQGDLPTAIERYGMVLKVDPSRASTRYQMALAMLDHAQGANAIREFKQTLSTNPRFFEAANQLSRVLATHPNPELRSPQEALGLAIRLCQITKDENPRFLDTRATAAAANGLFADAVKFGQQALALYQAEPRYQEHIAPLRERLSLFEAEKPWINRDWR